MTFVLARTHGVSDIKVCKIIVLKLACVAGGIVTAREIKFFPILLAASPLTVSAPPPKLYFAYAYSTASYAGYTEMSASE